MFVPLKLKFPLLKGKPSKPGRRFYGVTFVLTFHYRKGTITRIPSGSLLPDA
jgi:hypothetical protein